MLRTGIAMLLPMFLSAAALAMVKPHGLFSDNAVLQQGVRLPIWGWADPGEKVTVSLQGQRAKATAGPDGCWMAWLKPLKPGGPFTMSVAGKTGAVEVENVLVGEVWVCGGQSNMQWPVSQCENGTSVQANSADPQLRLVNMESIPSQTPRTDIEDKWQECGPKTVGGFSGVGYFFGRDLRKALNVPVGLIDTAIGGTRVQAWTSRSALGMREGVVEQDGMSEHNQPSVLYQGMICPLLPYAIRGVIWYQGESNAGEAFAYRELLPNMIRDWRRAWGYGEFPFLFVQLAPYGEIASEPVESAWAELREAQLVTSKTCPNTAMAVITDCGDPKDIHPARKEPVGARLALAALGNVYGRCVVYQGPTCRSMQIKGDRAVLTFESVGSGLEARGGELTGFTICGPDHKFHNAEATIQRDKVVVRSPEVAQPVAVRCGWSDCPVANLYNEEGLPASPFRTDDFPMLTAPK